MKILIAGASGFIGHALVTALSKHHQVSVLGRNKKKLQQAFSNIEYCYVWDELPNIEAKQFDTIINLCGLNIADSRWNASIKQQIIDSRVTTSKKLIDWAIQQNAKPHFICANAVGIYGIQNENDLSAFDENSIINMNKPIDFLSEIGVNWQTALQPAIDYGMPVTITRFGVVLQKGQGMLKKLALSFYLGLGAIVGSGKQTISWVHIQDVVNALTYLIINPELTGAFNLTSPYPVSQKEFAQTLATCLNRPLLLKMPAFIVHLLFGEMGDCLLLSGQRVLPERLINAGYIFEYPTLTKALDHEFKH